MQGSMRQRGDAWELMVYLGRDAVTGRKRYSSKTVKGGKREAQRALAALVAQAEAGSLAKTRATVGELLEEWFDQAKDDFSPKTAREARGYIDRYLAPGLGDVKLGKLGAADIDRFYRRLRERGGWKGRALSPATVRRAHGILHRALAQGVKWGWLGQNPASSATPPRVPVSDINPPSPAELARVFAYAQEHEPDLATFVVIAAATGARRSELIALRWSDIDLDRGVVSISRGIVLGRNGLVEKDTKTHAARRVSLDATSMATLQAHRERAVERAGAAHAVLAKSAFVFSNEIDSSVNWYPDSVSRAYQRVCRRVGLADVRLHDLRHYVATRLLSAGVDVRTVAGRLGHRNASTTLNVYSHFLAETDQEAANVLGRIFDDAVERNVAWDRSSNGDSATID